MPDSKPAKPATRTNVATHWLPVYASALAAVVLAFLLRKALIWLGGGDLPTYITFYPAVMIAALLGGVGPGLLATLASGLVVDYFILLPSSSFSITSLSDAIGLAFFSGMGVFMSVVAELYRRARQKAAGHETELLVRDQSQAPARWTMQGLLLNAGLVLSLAILAAAGWHSAESLRGVDQANQMVTRARAVMQGLDGLISSLKDAETGQRGFLLTGEEKYLDPFNVSLSLIQANLTTVTQLSLNNPRLQRHLTLINNLIVQKFAELNQTIELRRSQGLPAALAVVKTDAGKTIMDQLRKLVADSQDEENLLLQQRAAARNAEIGKSLQALLAGGVLAFIVLITIFLFLKQEIARRAKAEAELRHHRDHLKDMVATRTGELARSNDALRHQREWLRVTLTSIGDAVLATDTAGNVTFLNPVGQSLTGWSENEVLGRSAQEVFRIISEQTHAPGEDIIGRVLRENKIVALANHTALIARDGSEIPIEDSAAPIRDEYGTVSGVVLVFHDVTAKRRAQQALRESQEQYRSLFDTMLEGFCVIEVVFDPRGKPVDYRFLEVNPAFEKQTGLRNPQGKLMRDLAPDHEAHWFEIYGNIALTGQPARFVSEAKALNRWYDVSAYRVGGPESRKVAIFFNDITEREKMEEMHTRLAAIVESSDDAIMARNLHGALTSWNAAAQRLFGYSPQEVIGRSIKVILPPDRQDEEDAIMARLLAGERIQHFETVRLAKDGHTFPVSATMSPLKDGTGRIIGASKIIRDISERRHAEEKLRHQAEELQANNDILSRINKATVGRELRMIELKKEINDLCAKLGQPPAYSPDAGGSQSVES